MALLLIPNTASELTESEQWGELITRSNKNMLGYGFGIDTFTLTNWDDSVTKPQIAEGAIVEVGGSFYQADSDTVISNEAGIQDGVVHIKLEVISDGEEVTPILTNDTLPSWSANKVGWYSGTTKYLPYEMVLQSSEYLHKISFRNQGKSAGFDHNEGYAADSIGSKTRKGSVLISGVAHRENAIIAEQLSNKGMHEWTQKGNTFTLSAGNASTITALDKETVAIVNEGTGQLIAYRFDGTNFSQLGAAYTLSPSPALACITALSTTDIVYADINSDSLQTYRFDGATWTTVGNALDLLSISNFSIVALSNNSIAFIDTVSNQLRKYVFDGTDWTLSGAQLSYVDTTRRGLVALSSSDIVSVVLTGASKRLDFFRFTGYSSWVQLTNYEYEVFSSSNVNQPAISLSSNSFALYLSGENLLTVYTLTGNTWSRASINLDMTGATNVAITALAASRVAIASGATMKVYDLKYDTPPSPAFP